MSTFSSFPSKGPFKPWDDPLDNPAIGGIVRFNRTTFANFITACNGKKTVIFMPNGASGDIMHPTEMQAIKYINVTEGNKVHYPKPTLKYVNPADCVDMDCDGLRKLLIKDIDGSAFGTAGGSIVARSEYQWDGDRGFGLGE